MEKNTNQFIKAFCKYKNKAKAIVKINRDKLAKYLKNLL